MTTATDDAISVLEISLEEISINPFQPRRFFSEKELGELADSIKSVGLIQPPVVRKKPDGSGFELISGERRYRAARLAGLTTIPVIVRDASNVGSAESALVENIQRVDLNPLEIAKGLRRLMESFAFNQDELAERVGKKRSTIANYLRLLTLPKAVQDSLMSEEISMGHAKAILSVDGFERQTVLHEMIVTQGLSVRSAEEAAAKIAHEKPPSLAKDAVKSEKSIYIQKLEGDLRECLGTKVDIQAHGNKGKIIIDYYSLDDLDRVLALIAPAKQ